MERPALKNLLDAVRARRVDVIVVYKVDRLTRSLADFAKLVELLPVLHSSRQTQRARTASATAALNRAPIWAKLT